MADIVDISGQSRSVRRARPMGAVSGMVIHHTAGDSVKDAMTALNKRGLSVQYIVDRDGTIYQSFPEGMRATHMREPGSRHRIDDDAASGGFGNANLIGVEVVGLDDNDIRPAQVEAVKALAGDLSTKYGFPIANVWGHGELQSNKQSTEGATITAALRGLPPPKGNRYAGNPFGVGDQRPQDAQGAIASLIPPAGGPSVPDMPTAAMGYAPNLPGGLPPPAPPMPPVQMAAAPPMPAPPPSWAPGGGFPIDESLTGASAQDVLTGGPRLDPRRLGPATAPIAPDMGAMRSPADVLDAGPRMRPPVEVDMPMPPPRPTGPDIFQRNAVSGAPDAATVPMPPPRALGIPDPPWNPRRDPLGFPIDVNRPAITNPDGSFSTEETITFDASEVGLPPEIVTVPTIVYGQRVGEQEAMSLFAAGQNPPVQRGFGSFDEADAAARARTDSIGSARATLPQQPGRGPDMRGHPLLPPMVAGRPEFPGGMPMAAPQLSPQTPAVTDPFKQSFDLANDMNTTRENTEWWTGDLRPQASPPWGPTVAGRPEFPGALPAEEGPFFDNANPGLSTPPSWASGAFPPPPSPVGTVGAGSTGGEFFTPAPPMPGPVPDPLASRFDDAFAPGGGGQIMDLQTAFDRRNAPPTMNAQDGINSIFGAPPAPAAPPNLAIPFAEVPGFGMPPASAATVASPLPMPAGPSGPMPISMDDFDARFGGGSVVRPPTPVPGVTPGVVRGTMPMPGAMDIRSPAQAGGVTTAPAPLPKAPSPRQTDAGAQRQRSGIAARVLGGLLGGPIGAIGGGLLGGMGGSAAFNPIMGSGGTAPFNMQPNGQMGQTTYRHGTSGNMQGTMWNRSNGGSVGYVTDPFTGAMIYSASPTAF